MNVDATEYRRPASSKPPASELGIKPHQALRVGVGVATLYLYPWGETARTTFAHVEHPTRGLESAHLAPGTVDALLEIAPIVEPVALIRSPSWPIVDGPTPTHHEVNA